MSAISGLIARDGWEKSTRAALCAALFVLVAGPAAAAQKVMFPEPLHITREVADPISGTKTVVDEYCHGNRVVSVGATRTAIVDYDKGTMTAIDFAASTYSITKFEEIAKANARVGPAATAAKDQSEWRVEPRGGNVVASRPGEIIEAEHKGNQFRQTIRITADRQLTLSRGAVEALLGLAYPNARDAASDVILGALRSERSRDRLTTNSTSLDAEYRLPLEHVVRFEVGGETIETRNVVMRIGSEMPPAEKLAIPPGATLVDSEVVAAQRLLEELDRPPLPQNPR